MRKFVYTAPLLALLVACGGSSGSDGGEDGKAGTDSPSPSASEPAEAPPAVSAKELERLALADGEEVGDLRVRELAMEEPAVDLMEYEADPEVCQPLVGLWKGATDHDAEATVNRAVRLGDSYEEGKVDIQLRTYADGEAESVMAALRKAGTSCAGGFTEDRAMSEAPVESVTKAPLPELGDSADEAVSFKLPVQDVKEADMVFTDYLTVVRHGSVTASFRLDSKDQKGHGRVPPALVRAQLDRFQK